MLGLVSTSDEIQLVTAGAANIDVHASYVDGVAAFTPGRKDTLITTATTTTIVASPTSGVYRTVKTIEIRNRDTKGVLITVKHTDGTNAPEVISFLLRAGGTVAYDEQRGWSNRTGTSVQRRIYPPQAGPAVGDLYAHVLAFDIENADLVANTLYDVRELGFWAVAGQTYWIEFYVPFLCDATSTGSRFALYGPGLTTGGVIRTHMETSSATNTKGVDEGLSAFDTPANASSASAATAANWVRIEGFITPGTTGLHHLRFSSEVVGPTGKITIKAGAFLRYRRVL